MRREASRIHWRTALVGMAALAVLCGLWILLPTRAPAREGVARDAIVELHGALSRDDRAGLLRCREILRNGLHRDLLGRTLPGILRLVDALLQVDRGCSPGGADAFAQGVCALRQQRYADALRHFGALPKAHGQLAFGDVAARLLRLRNDELRTPGSARVRAEVQ